METSAEVAKWGEGWLAEYVAGKYGGDNDPELRKWIAGNWADWTLEDWARAATEERAFFNGMTCDEFNCNGAVRRELALYARTGNGLHIWRAYTWYRNFGLPIPEWLLTKLDEWWRRLEKASGAPAIAAAIDMSGKRGGPQGAALASLVERQFRTVSRVASLVRAGARQSVAIRRVATETGQTEDAVKAAFGRWVRERTASESDEHAALRLLGRGSRGG